MDHVVGVEFSLLALVLGLFLYSLGPGAAARHVGNASPGFHGFGAFISSGSARGVSFTADSDYLLATPSLLVGYLASGACNGRRYDSRYK